MTIPKEIFLYGEERIIAVVPEYAAGPGWANAITWVYIQDTATGMVRTESIQPEERTDQLHYLFDIGAAVTSALHSAILTYTVNNNANTN